MAKTKGTGYLLNTVALVLGTVGLICYLLSGEDQSKMTETYVSAMVYVPFILAILANAAGFFIKATLSMCSWALTETPSALPISSV